MVIFIYRGVCSESWMVVLMVMFYGHFYLPGSLLQVLDGCPAGMFGILVWSSCTWDELHYTQIHLITYRDALHYIEMHLIILLITYYNKCRKMITNKVQILNLCQGMHVGWMLKSEHRYWKFFNTVLARPSWWWQMAELCEDSRSGSSPPTAWWHDWRNIYVS